MKSYPWIICYDSSQGDDALALKCLRCGTKQQVKLPIIIRLWCAMAKQFENDHKQCEEKTKESS